MIKTLEQEGPLCGLFYTPEDLDPEYVEEETLTKSNNSNYFLYKQSFFVYNSIASMSDWDNYVESNPELFKD